MQHERGQLWTVIATKLGEVRQGAHIAIEADEEMQALNRFHQSFLWTFFVSNSSIDDVKTNKRHATISPCHLFAYNAQSKPPELTASLL
jgi:hypothetical protein